MVCKFKVLYVLAFIAALFPIKAPLEGATLHAIIVCDTYGEDIEASVIADFNRISGKVKSICEITKLKPHLLAYTGRKANSDFLNAADSLAVTSDDVILFYWSGHGLRFERQQDPWPIFDFTYDDTIVSQYLVTKTLAEKNPRLLLSVSDCCNDFAYKSLIPDQKKITEIQKKNYHTLFLQASGVYLATAALPGEFALGLNGKIREMQLPAGGFYTTALLEALDQETSLATDELSWEMIFTIAGEKTIEYQLRDEDDPTVYQHPHFEKIR